MRLRDFSGLSAEPGGRAFLACLLGGVEAAGGAWTSLAALTSVEKNSKPRADESDGRERRIFYERSTRGGRLDELGGERVDGRVGPGLVPGVEHRRPQRRRRPCRTVIRQAPIRNREEARARVLGVWSSGAKGGGGEEASGWET